MLVEQVAQNWNKLGGYVECSMPPLVDPEERQDFMTNVLFEILRGRLDLWILYNAEHQERAVVTTHIQEEPISKVRDLLIYSFTAVSRDLKIGEAEKVFNTLRRYATANGCKSIIAYSNQPRVVEFLASQGADVSYSLIKFEV